MGSKKKILIIHPEGNIYNNPNLYEIIHLLDKYYDVSILIPSLKINRNINDYKGLIIDYNFIVNKIKTKIKTPFFYNFFFSFFRLFYLRSKFDLIIGVDRQGLIDAYLLSKSKKCPYAHISYEILFNDETDINFKKIEIEASSKIEFSIVQDEVRGFHLSNENKIPIEKMLFIPVSSSSSKEFKKSFLLHDQLNINRNKKIVLFIGSISTWSCIQKIVLEVKNFPNDWVLVLHDRYGDSKKKLLFLFQENILYDRVFFSNEQVKTSGDMHKLLHSADLGLALYCPDYETIYTGKNLMYIGMASGKISTYLQNSIPVITYKNTKYGEYIDKYNLGYTIESINELPEKLKLFEENTLNDNCLSFFNEKLNFKNYRHSFLNKIVETIK